MKPKSVSEEGDRIVRAMYHRVVGVAAPGDQDPWALVRDIVHFATHRGFPRDLPKGSWEQFCRTVVEEVEFPAGDLTVAAVKRYLQEDLAVSA